MLVRSRVCNESATIFPWVSEFWALCWIPKHVGSALLVSDDIFYSKHPKWWGRTLILFHVKNVKEGMGAISRGWRQSGVFGREEGVCPNWVSFRFWKMRHFVMHQVAPFHRIRTVEILEVWAKNFTQVDKSELQVKLFCHRCTSKEPGSLLAVSSQQWLQLGLLWAITCLLKNASGPAFLTVSDCVLFSFASISLLLLS